MFLISNIALISLQLSKAFLEILMTVKFKTDS